MRASELRLNNWVWNDVQNIPVKVDMQIIQDQLYVDKGLKESWQPIPLTEEILLKCGFYIDFQNSNTISFLHRKLDVDAINYQKKSNTYYFNSWESSKCPQHLHQLQNLYHALTGEELEINL